MFISRPTVWQASCGFLKSSFILILIFPGAEDRRSEGDRLGKERDSKRRKKKPRTRKPWELDSEGEETSDGSSTEKVLYVLSWELPSEKQTAHSVFIMKFARCTAHKDS